jgi:peptide/nickel transport system substrate-binding protein
MGPDGRWGPQPGLALSWELSDKAAVFKLRQGVKFHDGTDFNAEAVKFSIERMKDPDNPGRSASNLLPIVEVNPIDDHTVQIVTDGPYGPLLNIMSLIYATCVVSPTAVEKSGEDFGRNPVGTGPFKFAEWKSNDSITIERFDDYWGDKALLDKAVYRVIPEESARMLALETGEVDMVMLPAPSQLETFKADDNFNVIEAEGVRVFYFGFNVSRPIAGDVKVRQAINYGVNRQEFVDNILEGAATVPTSYISPAVFGYKDVSAAWQYDVEKAKSLLEEAGWVDADGDGVREKDGQKLELRHLAPRGRYLKDAECAEAFQAAMREIGVQINLEILEWAALFEMSRQPTVDADLLTFGWSTATGDADYSLGPLFGTENTPPAGWNSHQYSNAEIDRLSMDAQQSTDPEERKQLYGQMLEILAEDAVWVPVYNSKEIVMTADYVKGFVLHPIDYYVWLDTVSLDKKA